MGYTHFWRRPKTLTGFEGFVADCKKIVEKAGVALSWEYDRPKKAPELSGKLVRFNGPNGKGHETFYVPKTLSPEPWQTPKEDGLWFEFCKTERKPYDIVVVACLMALKHHCPDVKVSTDGDDKDWDSGRELCQRALGYGREYSINDDGQLITK